MNCPQCDRDNDLDAKKCWWCEAELQIGLESFAFYTNKACTVCGMALVCKEAGDVFAWCRTCQVYHPPNEVSPESAAPSQQKSPQHSSSEKALDAGWIVASWPDAQPSPEQSSASQPSESSSEHESESSTEQKKDVPFVDLALAFESYSMRLTYRGVALLEGPSRLRLIDLGVYPLFEEMDLYSDGEGNLLLLKPPAP